MAKRMGAKTIEIEASHLALISHPDAITNLILRGTRRLRPDPVDVPANRLSNVRFVVKLGLRPAGIAALIRASRSPP